MKYLLVLSALVAVLVLYGFSYCLMLQGQYCQLKDDRTAGPEEPYYRFFDPFEPRFHGIGRKIVTMFFAPANAIDRRVRPTEWTGPRPLTESRVPDDVRPNPE